MSIHVIARRGSRIVYRGELSRILENLQVVPIEQKRCSMCENVKPLTDFHVQATGKHGRHSYCAVCANAIRNATRPTTSDGRGYEPEQKKRWHLKSRYGITPTQYNDMVAAQDGNCAMCGEKPERPCIDHNHETDAVRGILCHRCNIGLPYVEDAVFRLRALTYLDRYVADAPAAAVEPISFISMFSGIEAASVAFGPLGWKAICFAEIEKFPAAVLHHHYPDTPNVGDMSKHDWAQYRGRVDIVCGGPPCQAFSIAGLRGSLDDARGNLSLTYMKAIHAIKPRNAIIENVPGWLSTKDNAFGCFLAGLVGADDALPSPDGKRWPNAGMVAGPKGRAAWRILDAQYFGLSQRRKRVIVVADFGNGADPAAVLFEPESVPRNSPPSRETGQSVAPTISARTKGGGGLGTDFDLDGGLIESAARQWPVDIAPTLNAHFGEKQGLEDQHALNGAGLFVPGTVHAIQAGALRENPNSGPDGVGLHADITYTLEARAEVQAVSVTGAISHALKAEGADASEDGTGRGTPIIAFSAKDYGADATIELAPTLRAGGHTTSHPNAGVMPAIAYSVALRGRENGATAEIGDDVAFALRASGGGGDKPHVMIEGQACLTPWDSQQKRVYDANASIAPALSGCDGGGGRSPPAYQVASAVRRLTPRECERLMGFQFLVHSTYPGAWQDHSGRWWSPDYTAIPWRGKPAADCPDGPRYKSLGNSWAVPKFYWLGARIAALMPLPVIASPPLAPPPY